MVTAGDNDNLIRVLGTDIKSVNLGFCVAISLVKITANKIFCSFVSWMNQHSVIFVSRDL